jgi:hypothetical protein
VSILKKGLCSGLKGTRWYTRPKKKKLQQNKITEAINEIAIINKEKRRIKEQYQISLGPTFMRFEAVIAFRWLEDDAKSVDGAVGCDGCKEFMSSKS